MKNKIRFAEGFFATLPDGFLEYQGLSREQFMELAVRARDEAEAEDHPNVRAATVSMLRKLGMCGPEEPEIERVG